MDETDELVDELVDEIVLKIKKGEDVTIERTYPLNMTVTQLHFLLLLAEERGATVILQFPPSIGLNYIEMVMEDINPEKLLDKAKGLTVYGSVNLILPSFLVESLLSISDSQQDINVTNTYDGVSEVIMDLGAVDDYVQLETGRVVISPVPFSDLIPIPHPHLYYRIVTPLDLVHNRTKGLNAYIVTHYANSLLSSVLSDPFEVNGANGLTYRANLLLERLSQSYSKLHCCIMVALIDTCTCDFITVPERERKDIRKQEGLLKEKMKDIISKGDHEVYWKAWHHSNIGEVIHPEIEFQVNKLIKSLTGQEQVRVNDTPSNFLSDTLGLIRELYPKYTAIDINFYRYEGKKYVLSSWSWNSSTKDSSDSVTVLAHGGNVITSFV